MLKRTARRLLTLSEEKNSLPQPNAPLTATGGVPFIGNLYAGRVSGQNFRPTIMKGSKLLHPEHTIWHDPAVRAKLDQCPYFALCDQVMNHNMDPAHLDPGLLSSEEHQLLLLFSRAYYEKWKTIHKRPPVFMPQIRMEYGSAKLLDRMLDYLRVPAAVRWSLKKEYAIDDSHLIAMEPKLWLSAYLDPANLDHLSGRVLKFADMDETTQELFFQLLRQMRRIHVIRRDGPKREETREQVVAFHDAPTLYDFYRFLGLAPYSGQLKVYDYIDLKGTKLTITLQTEDDFFDFLMTIFYKANLNNATLGELGDENDYTAPYTITVEPFTVAERRVGRWFEQDYVINGYLHHMLQTKK